MDINERIKLTRQTLEALVDLRDGAAGNKTLEIMIECGTTDQWGQITYQSFLDSNGCAFLRLASKPQKVPLQPKDIPPGSVVSHPDWYPHSWAIVAEVIESKDTVWIGRTDGVHRTFQQLCDEGWTIKRPGDATWKPCWTQL